VRDLDSRALARFVASMRRVSAPRAFMLYRRVVMMFA
jgi:hypothetical protein